jgi:hypothetical protein
MKKHFSRSLILIALIVSLMAFMDLSASAKEIKSGDFIFETASSGATLKEYKGKASAVEIPSSVENYKVTSIGAEAFWQNKTMASVEIPSTITSIGKQAFSECTALTEIVFPSSVKNIGDNAFWYCTALKGVVIPESVISIGTDTFKGCDNLTAYIIEGTYGEEYIKSLGNIKIGYRYAKEMKLNYTSLTIGLTAERQIEVAFTPEVIYSSEVTYKSSDTKVVTVSSKGVVKAVGMGKATITVTSSDDSKLSKTISVTVNPQKVKTLKKTEMTSESISLKWSKVADTTGYKLYKYNSKTKKWDCITTTSKNYYTDKNVKMGDTPQYKVRAYAKLKTATYYGAFSSVLKLTMAKPGTVSALDIAAAENYAKLTWKAAENANGYRVYLYDTKTESFVKKASTTSLSAKITGLKDNTEYKFAVQAYYKSSSGDVVFSDKQIEASVATRPVSVGGLTYDKNNVYFDKITLSWKPLGNISGYEIHILNTATKQTQTKTVAADKTSYTLSALSSETKYTFKIRAYTQRESGTVYSYYSSTVSVKTLSLPATPQAAFDSFIEALNNTKNYTDKAVLYKDVAINNFSGDKNDTILRNIAVASTDIYRFTEGKTSDGKTVSAFIGPESINSNLGFADINASSVRFKTNGSGYDITFTLNSEGSSADKNSLITNAVDWSKVKNAASGFNLVSCNYTGTTVTAKIQDGLVSYMEISMPMEVSFKTGLAKTYSFSQTIVTTTAFVTV